MSTRQEHEYKFIRIHKDTYNKIRKLGVGSESMNTILNRMTNNLKLNGIALDLVRGNETR